LDYREAGVDVSVGNKIAKNIAKIARKSHNHRVVKELGGFGGFFSIKGLGYNSPVLVSSADGIGTKLLIARKAGVYRNLGLDIVHHCINDIACCGAKPLFFLDYFASSVLNAETVETIVGGMADALKEADCPLVGGETAEMPDLYSPGDFDIAGFIVGVVDRESIIDGSAIKPGDSVIILPSNGLHTNGFTLARKALFDKAGLSITSIIPPLNNTLGEELLKPHISYLNPILKISRLVNGLAHITGGGLKDNISRILPDNCRAIIDLSVIPIPPIFDIIQKAGSIEMSEMYKVFNMGAGLAIVVGSDKKEEVLELIKDSGFEPMEAGYITSGEREVILEGIPS